MQAQDVLVARQALLRVEHQQQIGPCDVALGVTLEVSELLRRHDFYCSREIVSNGFDV